MSKNKIIPAEPGFQLIGARVTNGECVVERVPIVAWQCFIPPLDLCEDDKKFTFGLAYPVLPHVVLADDEDSKTHFVEYPDKRISDGTKVVFANLEEAKKFLVELQRDYTPKPRKRGKQ